MSDYMINGKESSWEDIVRIAKEKHLQNIDKSTIKGLIASLSRKGIHIVRIPQDHPLL